MLPFNHLYLQKRKSINFLDYIVVQQYFIIVFSIPFLVFGTFYDINARSFYRTQVYFFLCAVT